MRRHRCWCWYRLEWARWLKWVRPWYIQLQHSRASVNMKKKTHFDCFVFAVVEMQENPPHQFRFPYIRQWWCARIRGYHWQRETHAWNRSWGYAVSPLPSLSAVHSRRRLFTYLSTAQKVSDYHWLSSEFLSIFTHTHINSPIFSWYSWTLNSLVNGVYAFGFLFMLPQLFVNYKMKSVAALPWRSFMYKAFNTFIDDIFAFIITMPTAHRIACFRDDVVFVIYLVRIFFFLFFECACWDMNFGIMNFLFIHFSINGGCIRWISHVWTMAPMMLPTWPKMRSKQSAVPRRSRRRNRIDSVTNVMDVILTKTDKRHEMMIAFRIGKI